MDFSKARFATFARPGIRTKSFDTNDQSPGTQMMRDRLLASARTTEFANAGMLVGRKANLRPSFSLVLTKPGLTIIICTPATAEASANPTLNLSSRFFEVP